MELFLYLVPAGGRVTFSRNVSSLKTMAPSRVHPHLLTNGAHLQNTGDRVRGLVTSTWLVVEATTCSSPANSSLVEGCCTCLWRSCSSVPCAWDIMLGVCIHRVITSTELLYSADANRVTCYLPPLACSPCRLYISRVYFNLVCDLSLYRCAYSRKANLTFGK